ncbi:UNVERIFIED_CONTAM: Man2a2 [Trichonephila clavipes]
MQIKFFKYGTKTKGKDKSGAYLFLPDTDAKEIDYNKPEIFIVEGPLISEVIVMLKDVEHHVLLKNSPGFDGAGIEIYNLINIASETNKELIMRFITNITSEKQEFYTDLNGLQKISVNIMNSQFPASCPWNGKSQLGNYHVTSKIKQAQAIISNSLRFLETTIAVSKTLVNKRPVPFPLEIKYTVV